MQSLSNYHQLIEKQIADSTYPNKPIELYEPIAYLMAIGGKRLRPSLVLMACEAVGGDIQKALKPALAIEVFHNFTLMHDDIMDNAPLRRGKLTVHEKWNKNTAILSGDVMLVEAYKLLLDVEPTHLKQTLEIFNNTAAAVCEGQQLDMNFETISHVSIPEYIEMIGLKTAVLLAASLQIGSLIGNADEQTQNHLYEFGKNMGIAFQLQDDLLDVYGDPDKFGKKVGGDILTNKKTFMLISAIELAKEDLLTELNYWLTIKEFDESEKINSIIEIYDQLGIRSLAELEIDRYFSIAIENCNALAISQLAKDHLLQFAERLMIREK